MLFMNSILAMFPESFSPATEPMAIMLWGIALLLLSTWRPAKSSNTQASSAVQQASASPLTTTVTSAHVTLGS